MATITNITSNLTDNIQLEKGPAILIAVLITTGLWIIIINLLVFSCLITSHSAKKSFVNLQLLSLSVTDMLVGAFSIPVTLTFKITGSFPTYGACASLFYLYIVSQAATLNHALTICVHRLITVKRKHHNSAMKPKYLAVFLQVLSVWIVSFIVISIPFLIYGRFGETLSPCSLNTLFADDYTSAIGIFTSFLLIPHISLNIVYLYMLWFLKQKWKRIDLIDNGLGDTRMTRVGDPGISANQSLTPIEVTESTNDRTLHASQQDNAFKSPRATMKTNDHEVHRNGKAIRLVGFKTDTLSVRSTIIPSCTETIQPVGSNMLPQNSTRNTLQVWHNPGTSAKSKAGGFSRSSGIGGQKRVLVTIGILLVILNVFMTPLDFLTLFEFLHKGYLSRRVKFIFMNMAILNSALNPIINVFRVRPFREALKMKALKLCRLLCRCLPR